MNKIEGLQIIMDALMDRYSDRVRDVKKIIQAMVDRGIINKADDIQNDHIAFRSLGLPQLGIQSLEKIFLHYGYTKRDHLNFEAKKLDAYWYAPPAPNFPRIFISELRVHELSSAAQAILHSYTDEVAHDPVEDLNLDDPRAVGEFLHQGLWRLPTVEDYQSLQAESEYASWVIYNRYYLNHYTISLHHLPQAYNTCATFNDFLEGIGIKLNDAGGKIKISPDGLLCQSSTVAQIIDAPFADGRSLPIAGSYVEFAERRVLPAFAHLDHKDLKREHFREGFEAGNADKIFESTFSSQVDFLPLLGTDFVEFYVGNAKQAAHYYKTAFGYQDLAYSGPETGDREKVSYVLKQDKVRLILTTALHPDHPIAQHTNFHGDGVKTIALTVNDARDAFHQTTSRGAKAYMEPKEMTDEHGTVVMSGIHIYGDTVHLFVERKNYSGIFLPGFRALTSAYNPASIGLKYIDHCVGNVGWNEMNPWVKFYEDVMGFKNILTFDDRQVSTEYSALMSKVMSNGNGYVKFPINEPAKGKKKSQVEEYLDFYGGPGVQHIAIATDNIMDTVIKLRSRGVDFLQVPGTYYDDLAKRVGPIEEDIDMLRPLGILVDRDDEGYLLQIFTKPVEDRPTLFYEIIQRRGAKSFGAGNFKALFEALEREQGLRGNL